MTGSRHDLPRERAIHRALASDGAQQDALEPEPSRVPTSLLLCLYLTQTAIAGIFCAICYWAYGGALPASLAHFWPALLAILAMAWTGALPLLAWLWRFAPSVETRLTLWGSYWIGLIALPVALLVIAVGVVRRGKREVVAPRSELSLLAGVIITWPIMQVAAYLACEEALPVSLAEDALSPYWSFVLAYGACLALPLALTAMALHVRRRRLVQAANAREIAGTGALVPGEAMVTGVVELAEGESCAVELRIDQEGTEQESSGTWSHTWTETGRRLTVRPFYLRTKAGDRVRVLAGDQVKLMDALDRKILVNRTARTCIAELTPGEAVSAFGQLFRGRDPEAVSQAGYRSGAVGWVLRSPEGGKMLLSSYPIYRPFDERARRILWWVAALLVVVVAGHVALLGYHLRVAWGERIPATVTDARIVKEETDDGYELKRVVTVMLASARRGPDETLTREVTAASYPNATSGRIITVLREPLFSTSNFGPYPTTSFGLLVLVGLVVLLCLVLRASDRPDARWYLESTVVEQGSGRLSDTRTASGRDLSEIRALVDEELGRRS